MPLEVERWLHDRTRDEFVQQMIHIPSHPFGWSAGKWREWYPDVADGGETGTQTAKMGVDGERFRLTTRKAKFMWQTGWWNQHQRLLQSMSNQKLRPGLVLSGDLRRRGTRKLLQWRPLFRVKSNSFDHYWSSGHRFGMAEQSEGDSPDGSKSYSFG